MGPIVLVIGAVHHCRNVVTMIAIDTRVAAVAVYHLHGAIICNS